MHITVKPIHFEDFSGTEFERLLFAYLYMTQSWHSLEWLGQTGTDGGRDIWGTKIDELGKQETFCFQCANHRNTSAIKAIEDIQKLVNSDTIPVYFTLVCGGAISANARQKVVDFALQNGIANPNVWSGTELEEKLRNESPRLLQRFLNGVAFPDSVEDINLMISDLPANRSDQLIAAAEAFTKLGKLDKAIDKLSQAIDVMPSAKLLLMRGTAYALLQKFKQSLDDLCDALLLANSEDLQEFIRMERAKLLSLHYRKNSHPQIWAEDFEWLKKRLKHKELGELLYYSVREDLDFIYEPAGAEEAVEVLDEAIQLGYKEPNVYRLRADANCATCNYRDALQDIEQFINSQPPQKDLLDALEYKANILFKMKRFDEVFQIYSETRQKYDKDGFNYFDITWGIEEEILCRYAIDFEFGEFLRKSIPAPTRFSTQLRVVEVLSKHNGNFARKYPKLAEIIARLTNRNLRF